MYVYELCSSVLQASGVLVIDLEATIRNFSQQVFLNLLGYTLNASVIVVSGGPEVIGEGR